MVNKEILLDKIHKIFIYIFQVNKGHDVAVSIFTFVYNKNSKKNLLH